MPQPVDPRPDEAAWIAPAPASLPAAQSTNPHDLAAAFEARGQREAEVLLDMIQEALRTEKHYDKVELLQRLVPQWKSAIEQGRKAFQLDREAPPRPAINIHLVSNVGLPPLAGAPPRPAIDTDATVEVIPPGTVDPR